MWYRVKPRRFRCFYLYLCMYLSLITSGVLTLLVAAGWVLLPKSLFSKRVRYDDQTGLSMWDTLRGDLLIPSTPFPFSTRVHLLSFSFFRLITFIFDPLIHTDSFDFGPFHLPPTAAKGSFITSLHLEAPLFFFPPHSLFLLLFFFFFVFSVFILLSYTIHSLSSFHFFIFSFIHYLSSQIYSLNFTL